MITNLIQSVHIFFKSLLNFSIYIFKILKLLLSNIFFIFNTKTLLSNHLKSYKNLNEITEKSVKQVYNRYTTYLILLLISIVMFGLFTIFSFYTIGIIFFIIFIILIIFIPSLFIFHSSLLSSSRLLLLVISYIFTVMSFALIFYIIQMLSIENIHDTSLVAFKISNYEKLEEIKNFNDFFSFLYFSIVTITTLGYGDITPLSTIAKIASSFEVILGITYTVFGVATLFSNKENDKEIAKHIEKIIGDKKNTNKC